MLTLDKYQPSNAKLQSTLKCVLLDQSNKFIFSGLSIDTSGFYILSAQITSSDNKFNFQATSNYIRIQEKSYVYNSDIADSRNLVFQFTGDNTDSLQEQRKAMFGDLLVKYGLTVQGPIYIYLLENNVYLTTSVNLVPRLITPMVETLVNYTSKTDVISGLSLVLISYYDGKFAKALVSDSTTAASVWFSFILIILQLF